MPEEKITDALEAVRILLREGRTTEADRSLATLDQKIKDAEAARLLETPPPGPRTMEQLTIDFYIEVTDLLGNNPRLLALLTEMKGLLENPPV